jgi:hypothetical protein
MGLRYLFLQVLFTCFLFVSISIFSSDPIYYLLGNVQALRDKLTLLRDLSVVLQERLELLKRRIDRLVRPLHAGTYESLIKIVDDLKWYKTTNGEHVYHLFEHLVAAARVVEQQFRDQTFFVENLDLVKDREVALWAVFFHDIGKAGNPEAQIFFTVGGHDETGFNFLRDGAKYKMVSEDLLKKDFFDNLFFEFGLSEDEVKVVQIACRCHWEGFNFLNNQPAMYDAVRAVAQAVGYNSGRVDERLLRLVALVIYADVRGMREVDFPGEYLLSQVGIDSVDTIKTKSSGGSNFFENFGYASKSQPGLNALIEHFKKAPAGL